MKKSGLFDIKISDHPCALPMTMGNIRQLLLLDQLWQQTLTYAANMPLPRLSQRFDGRLGCAYPLFCCVHVKLGAMAMLPGRLEEKAAAPLSHRSAPWSVWRRMGFVRGGYAFHVQLFSAYSRVDAVWRSRAETAGHRRALRTTRLSFAGLRIRSGGPRSRCDEKKPLISSVCSHAGDRVHTDAVDRTQMRLRCARLRCVRSSAWQKADPPQKTTATN